MQFVDGRNTLPRHPTKRWARRNVADLLGGVAHHTAGGDDPVKTAAYHVGPSHTSADGMPGLAYTFFIAGPGTITWANDLDARTWSQGGKKAPDVDGDGDVDADDGLGNANAKFVGICLGGSFDGPHNRTGQEPTAEQVLALLALWAHLVGHHRVSGWPPELYSALGHLTMADLWAHADFGKPACPGRTITELLAALRTHRAPARSIAEWQTALVDAGFDLGSFGPSGNGVDGDWGTASRRALADFQRSRGLPVTGHRDDATAAELFR